MHNYRVGLYPGAGVELFTVEVEARDPEDALVQASIQIPCVFHAEDTAAEEGIVEELENDPQFVYLDRTEYGEDNGYLFITNAIIEELKGDQL